MMPSNGLRRLALIAVLVAGGLGVAAGTARGASFDVNGPQVEMRRIQFCGECGKPVNVTRLPTGGIFVCPGCGKSNAVVDRKLLRITVSQLCPRCQSLLDVHDCIAGESIQCPVCHEVQPVLAEALLGAALRNPSDMRLPGVVRRGGAEDVGANVVTEPAEPAPERAPVRQEMALPQPAAGAPAPRQAVTTQNPTAVAATPGVSDMPTPQAQPLQLAIPVGVAEPDRTRTAKQDDAEPVPSARSVAQQRGFGKFPAAKDQPAMPEKAAVPSTVTNDAVADTARVDIPAAVVPPSNPESASAASAIPAQSDTTQITAAPEPAPRDARPVPSVRKAAMAEVMDEDGPVIPRGAIERPGGTLFRPRPVLGNSPGISSFSDNLTAPHATQTSSAVRVAAMVNGSPIHANEVELRLSFALERERERMGSAARGEDGYRTLLAKASTLRAGIIDELINDRLVLESARKEGLIPSQQDIAAEAERMRLAERRSTLDDNLLRRAAERCTITMLRERLVPAGDPHPRKMKSYHETHRRDFMEPARATVRAVVVYRDRAGHADRRTAQEIMVDVQTRLHQTGDFSAVVREFSEDVFAADGGVQCVGTEMHRPVDSFASPIRKVLRHAATADLIGPVDCGGALALVFVDKVTGGSPKPLSEVQEEVVRAIHREEADEALQVHIRKLRSTAQISIF